MNDNKVKKYNGEEEDDEIVMLIGQFTKFFRYDKFGGNQRNFRRKKVDKEEWSNMDAIICYECKKLDHVKYDCSNVKKKGSKFKKRKID